MNKQAILEGLLFVSGDEGLSIPKIKEILEVDNKELEKILLDLKEEYSKDSRGIKLEVLGTNLKLTTKKEHKDYYQKVFEDNNNFYSQSVLETLAIIAYNAPITRVQIDEIRGVNSSYIIRKLLSREMIKDVGKSDLPGRPTLYDVTLKFLDYFGLSSKDDLPKLEIKEEVDEDVELYTSKYEDE